ncbi:unnamed protein product [Clonostachys rosea]|uniref:Uncharacterized protein n=1 Tax=Bionectria ochroleuca TaxID=29856 RepID=A0ABY6TW71_BIOOC|nr:unnamed protein product [Clonostachys rosea]
MVDEEGVGVAESLGGMEEVVAIERLEGVDVLDTSDVEDIEDTSDVVEALGVLDKRSDEVPGAVEVPLPGVGVRSVLDSNGVGVLLELKVVSSVTGVEFSGVVSGTKVFEIGAEVGVAEDEITSDEGESLAEGVEALLLWHLCFNSDVTS